MGSLCYAWKDTYRALKTMADSDRDPYEGALLRYVNPATAGFTYPTMSCEVQLFKAREKTKVHRHTSTALYHVFKGQGRTAVGKGHLEWKRRFFCHTTLAVAFSREFRR